MKKSLLSSHTLWHGDCREVLPHLPSESVQLTMTSPPYAFNKDYEKGRDEKWITDLVRGVAPLLLRVTKPSGFCVVNFTATTRFEVMPEEMYARAFRDAGWILQSRRIWAKPLSALQLPASGIARSVPAATFENLMTFRKPPNTDERPWLAQKEQRKLSTHAIWYTPKGAAEEKVPRTFHPACFPMELPIKAIRLWSQPGDIVLDPFAGCMTTVMAAHHESRVGIGIEQDETYYKYGHERLKRYVSQEVLYNYNSEVTL